jgi:nucleotide-binding universal stress UspA family protein
MLRKILCPVDFSPASQQALRIAARIAADRDAELVVVHVWYVSPLVSGEFPIPADALKAMADEEQQALARAVHEANAVGAHRVASRMIDGVPWDRIVDTARQDRECDLIVIGTHGRTGVARWMLGSVAEKVVRHAPCSVLVARGRDSDGFRHVVCPVDFSDSSRFALEHAAALGVPGGSRIYLLHVIEPPQLHRAARPNSDLQYDVDKRATMQLDDWAAKTRLAHDLEVRIDLRTGDPASEVLSVIGADVSVDLVTLGTHGRTGIQRVLLGSVAEKIVRHSPCPVLVARRRS